MGEFDDAANEVCGVERRNFDSPRLGPSNNFTKITHVSTRPE